MAPRVKVHAGDTPTESIVKSANGSVTVTDVSGRAITVKKTTPFDRMRVFKAIGAANVQNPQYVGYAMLAASVTAIDGEVVPFPMTEREIEFMVQRLGEEGFDIVSVTLAKFFNIDLSEDELEKVKN